ncbi:hypothetical protein ACMU_01580 [Actibacterium mucosum KCTC 23349]|uniref:DUF1761 domain-containing protein n=1 Tax=Actibacterium mucosum KCTC 23349 TaxID=1454373 RepID=A0A037ZL84_9RHOB|nr:DUF1761 domain-containing protein [Actibacterium mucosum]KAJ57211.1 hypothetical protein ACMU_01580 [Actibacterium mucosum KCTC 23349]
MEIVSVIVAAIAAYAFGSVWYMVLAKPWMAAAGLEADENGRPANGAGAAVFVAAFISTVVVAGMMRHIFALAGIDGAVKGLIAGLGLGLFIVVPWIATNYGFSGRPRNLLLIDGGYATIGCAVIGLVLALF